MSLVIHVTGYPVDSSWPLQVQWLSLIVQLIFHGHFRIYYLLVRLVEWKQLFISNIDFFSFEFVSNGMKLCADVFMSVLVYRYKKIIVVFPQILVDIFVERQSTMLWVRWDAYKNPWSGVTCPFVPQKNGVRICRSGSVDGPCKRLQQASPYYWRKSFLIKR